VSRAPRDAGVAGASERALEPAEIAAAAQLACLLEASAPKPGNVSPGRHFADTRYEDFLASAAAIGLPLAGAGTRPLGATIRLAIESTTRWTRSNTNLGIVLLLAPLARAAIALGSDPGDRRDWGQTPEFRDAGFMTAADSRLQKLRTSLRRVLDATTVGDAKEVYAAIRLASPGGLGHVQAQDVATDPSMTLLEVMRLAADRDGIAREYATAFETTFASGAPALARARREGLSWDDAVVETFLTLVAAVPDTHIVRRGGIDVAMGVSRRSAAALAAGGVRTDDGRRAIAAMDAALRDPRNTANPGTAADLTAAAILAMLLIGEWDRA
jgi:triphosphoribosyl-dephospho-CoA synthase